MASQKERLIQLDSTQNPRRPPCDTRTAGQRTWRPTTNRARRCPVEATGLSSAADHRADVTPLAGAQGRASPVPPRDGSCADRYAEPGGPVRDREASPLRTSPGMRTRRHTDFPLGSSSQAEHCEHRCRGRVETGWFETDTTRVCSTAISQTGSGSADRSRPGTWSGPKHLDVVTGVQVRRDRSRAD